MVPGSEEGSVESSGKSSVCIIVIVFPVTESRRSKIEFRDVSPQRIQTLCTPSRELEVMLATVLIVVVINGPIGC